MNYKQEIVECEKLRLEAIAMAEASTGKERDKWLGIANNYRKLVDGNRLAMHMEQSIEFYKQKSAIRLQEMLGAYAALKAAAPLRIKELEMINPELAEMYKRLIETVGNDVRECYGGKLPGED